MIISLIILFSLSMLVWLIFFVDAIFGLPSINSLSDEAGLVNGPLLSVIVAARNEEEKIALSIQSQLNQTYQHVEWILINDRSEDATGTIIDELQQQDSRIKVIHIDKLPSGWLGKNYASYQGSLKASGKWLLFTDADVVYNNQAFAKALHYFTRKKLDHLTAAPYLRVKGFWLQSFIAFFLFSFSYLKRPWLANSPNSKTGSGIGAFNLISKKAYESFGTHQQIKMDPDDDLQLGMQLKRAGYKQNMVTALEFIEVEWYESLKEALIGLEKNTFAGLNYRISMVVFAVFGVFTTNILPFMTVFSTNKTIMYLSLANILLIGIYYLIVVRKMSGYSPILFLVFPITACIFIYSIIRASFLTFIRGGIVWRGTKYSLKELRNNQKRN